MNDKITHEAEPLHGVSLKKDFGKNIEATIAILAIIILLILIIRYSQRGQGAALGLGEVLPMIEG